VAEHDHEHEHEHEAALAAAVDIGGTKIAGGLVDGRGRIHPTASRPTPATGDAEAVMHAVGAVIDELSTAARWPAVDALGICSAGPVDIARGAVSPVNIPAWREYPLIERIRRHPAVAGRPVTLAGDAVAMAAGEHLYGAAAGSANALCIVVSTGVGGGLVLGGRVMPGATGNAGHIGHISVDLDGEPCPCGGRGCLERLASGPAIARQAAAMGWSPSDGDVSAAAVARSAAAGDRAALAAFDRAAQALAVGIAATAALVEIDTVVIGGGVAQAGELLFAPVREWLGSYATLAFTREISVVPAQLGTNAGLSGAAAYARSRSAMALPAAP
jgi:glucokinase